MCSTSCKEVPIRDHQGSWSLSPRATAWLPETTHTRSLSGRCPCELGASSCCRTGACCTAGLASRARPGRLSAGRSPARTSTARISVHGCRLTRKTPELLWFAPTAGGVGGDDALEHRSFSSLRRTLACGHTHTPTFLSRTLLAHCSPEHFGGISTCWPGKAGAAERPCRPNWIRSATATAQATWAATSTHGVN